MSVPDSDPMPVFTIKARDNLAPATIANYAAMCEVAGLDSQVVQVRDALEEIVAWRKRNPRECKWPDHNHVPVGQPGAGT